jgi:alpha-galactosidase
MTFTVAFIGAGSIGFTRTLVGDLLAVPAFADIEISLHDISARNLSLIEQLLRRDLAANGCRARLRVSTDRRAALHAARYVINVARIGGIDAFRHDIEIPLGYGIDQCVGDTLCAGGIMYGQRGIAAMLDFCADIRAVAEPGAKLLNYANPMAMLTWAANTYGGVDCIGLCHGVQGGHHQIAQVIERMVNQDAGLDPDGAERLRVAKQEVDIICAGINHQTWYLTARYQGEDWCPRLLDGFERHPVFARREKVRIDMLRRFGYYSTESNGHLSEYLPWYRKRGAEIADWICLDDWIHGETGGYLRTCAERRNWFEEDFPRWMAEEPPHYDAEHRSEEHGSWIIEALETGRVYRGHFNRINGPSPIISNLPTDCVVEAPGYVDRSGLHMIHVGALPWGCASVCLNAINVQRLAVMAAVHADLASLRQAMLLDPLVGAVCNPPEVWQLVDDLLIALAAWMPQWQEEAQRAQQRQERARAEGRRLPTREGHRGAARLSERTVAELQAGAGLRSDAAMVGAG